MSNWVEWASELSQRGSWTLGCLSTNSPLIAWGLPLGALNPGGNPQTEKENSLCFSWGAVRSQGKGLPLLQVNRQRGKWGTASTGSATLAIFMQLKNIGLSWEIMFLSYARRGSIWPCPKKTSEEWLGQVSQLHPPVISTWCVNNIVMEVWLNYQSTSVIENSIKH